MKKIYLLCIATVGLLMFNFNAYSENSLPSIKEYRNKYSALVDKWNKEKDVISRLELRIQIENLKKDNLTLFKKKYYRPVKK
jgi:hypothetical protein